MVSTKSLITVLSLAWSKLATANDAPNPRVPNSCGKATTEYSSSTADYRCNETFAPTAKFAQSALLKSTSPQVFADCINTCYNTTACKTLTYRPSDKTCNLYKFQVGPNLKLQSTPGTQFYDKRCLDPLLCFKLQIRGTFNQYNGSFVSISPNGRGNHAFTVTDPANAPRFYYSRQFNLISDAVGLEGYEYHNDAHPKALPYTIFFPGNQFLQNYHPESRKSIRCDNDHIQGSGKLTCTSDAGNTFYACEGDSSQLYSGIALAPGDVKQPFKNSGSQACLPVSVYLVVA